MRVYIIASVLIIAGLLSIVLKGYVSSSHWFFPFLNDLSSTLLVGGMISLLFKVFQDRESENALRRLLRIHDSVDELGLQEIFSQSQDYNFRRIIDDSDSLSIVMNDGCRWVGNYTVNLRCRFSKRCETSFFTVDPDCDFARALASKIEMPLGDLQKKIANTWKLLENVYNESTKKGVLRIYKLKNYPTRSLFLTETMLVETPYQAASGRVNIPVYVYRKVARQDSLFNFASRDIESLRSESTLLKELKG